MNRVKLKNLKPNGVYYHVEQDMIMLGFNWEPCLYKDEKYFRMYNVQCNGSREVTYVFSCNQKGSKEIIYIGDL